MNLWGSCFLFNSDFFKLTTTWARINYWKIPLNLKNFSDGRFSTNAEVQQIRIPPLNCNFNTNYPKQSILLATCEHPVYN